MGQSRRHRVLPVTVAWAQAWAGRFGRASLEFPTLRLAADSASSMNLIEADEVRLGHECMSAGMPVGI